MFTVDALKRPPDELLKLLVPAFALDPKIPDDGLEKMPPDGAEVLEFWEPKSPAEGVDVAFWLPKRFPDVAVELDPKDGAVVLLEPKRPVGLDEVLLEAPNVVAGAAGAFC